MVKIYTALGYDAFLNLLRDLEKAEEPIFLLFTASRGPKGKSWNSECEKAETAIEEAAHLAPKDSRLVYVQVGNKATWEDPKCFFRKDPVVQLQALPTLFLWGSRLKLQERQCSELESLRKFFEAASRTAEDTPRQEYVEYVQTQDKS